MKRYFILFLSVFLVVMSVLPVFAAAFTPVFFEPTHFVDPNNQLHQYCWFNSESDGIIYEFVTPYTNGGCTVYFQDPSSDTPFFRCYAMSYPVTFTMYVYNLRSGALMASLSSTVTAATQFYQSDLIWTNSNYVSAYEVCYGSSTSYGFDGIENDSFNVYLLNYSSLVLNSIPLEFKDREENGFYFTSLSKPVADLYNSYLIVEIVGRCFIIRFTTLNLTSDEVYTRIGFTNSGLMGLMWPKLDTSYDVIVTIYDVSDGNYVASNIVDVPAGTGFQSFYYSNLNSQTIVGLDLIGCSFDPSYYSEFNLPSVQWNTDMAVYTSVNLHLTLIQALLLSGNRELQSIADDLSDFFIESVTLTQDIHDLLLNNLVLTQDIYDLLLDLISPEADDIPTFEEVPSSSLDDFQDSESKVYDVIGTDFAAEADSILNFDSNSEQLNSSAFGFINGILEGTVFYNNKLNSLVVFCLAMGIAVLILGRRLNV